MPDIPLTTTDIDDTEAFWKRVHLVLHTTAMPSFLPMRQLIRERQHRLRGAGREAWRTYLELEELVNEYHADVVFLLVRWAFEQGVQEGRRG